MHQESLLKADWVVAIAFSMYGGFRINNKYYFINPIWLFDQSNMINKLLI